MNPILSGLKKAMRQVLPRPVFEKVKRAIIPEEYIIFSGGWKARPRYNEDGMATAHNADFLQSPEFLAAYNAGYATESWGPVGRSHLRWRVFNACTLAKYALRVPGEFVECGTNKGGVATAVIQYTNFAVAKKRFFLLDTYQGYDLSILSEKEHASGGEEYNKRYVDCYEQVRQHFAKFDFVRIIKGTVPATLQQVDAEKVAFLHLDMNCAAPERAAIEFFWDKITPGGVVLLDDYGWDGREEQKRTLDEFAAAKGLEVVGMATGQGLILKPYW